MEAMGNRKGMLKSIMKQLHQGASVEEIKEKAKEVLKELTPTEIAEVEQELINEGVPREMIQKLCDIHLAVFKESLEKQEVSVPSWHPVYILMEEHKMVLSFADKLKQAHETDLIEHILHHLKDSEKHYLREENVLFPYLEKHGVTEPPAIMWQEHDKIREMEKKLYDLFDGNKIDEVREMAYDLHEMLSNHFYKENNILFPTGLKVIGENEWKDIRQQFDDIGYCCFTPEPEEIKEEEACISEEPTDMINFETGSFTKDELETMLNALPVDITFVDKDDKVRYFSQSKDRIFVRTKAIIGRTVQQCHPSKSVDVVNKIVNEFKNGNRDKTEFWLDMNGRKIYIRYFPVRREGKYIGTLEVTQDITDIKKIEGQKRLLDWE